MIACKDPLVVTVLAAAVIIVFELVIFAFLAQPALERIARWFRR